MSKYNRMELYRQGLNDSAIAELEGVSQSAISAWRRKLGLPQFLTNVNKNIQKSCI